MQPAGLFRGSAWLSRRAFTANQGLSWHVYAELWPVKCVDREGVGGMKRGGGAEWFLEHNEIPINAVRLAETRHFPRISSELETRFTLKLVRRSEMEAEWMRDLWRRAPMECSHPMPTRDASRRLDGRVAFVIAWRVACVQARARRAPPFRQRVVKRRHRLDPMGRWKRLLTASERG